MKRIFSLLLSTLLAVLMVIPSFAATEARSTSATAWNGSGHGLLDDDEATEVLPTFTLSEVIEGYKPHTADEIAEFKKYLCENEMLTDLLFPQVCANVYAVSNHETLRTVKRGEFDVFGDEQVIIGIKKDNGFVTISSSEFLTAALLGGLYGSDKGQHCRLSFSDDAILFLNSLSYAEREAFMLEFYLSVADTEEAIGLNCDKLLRTGLSGDVNGDGKINAKDNLALGEFLAGKSSGIIPQYCDMDKNGTINFRDKFYIKLIIIGA